MVWRWRDYLYSSLSRHLHYVLIWKQSKWNVPSAESGEPFERLLREHRRSVKLKRDEFCSGTCSTTKRNKNLPTEGWNKCYKIKRHAGNRRDEYSPFRKFLQSSRASLREHRCELNVIYLKQLWDNQGGICPYTGIKMLLPETSAHAMRSPKKASLDRIDSSKDYIKGNVEFVCCAINLAKNSFTRDQMKEFIAEIGGDAGHCPRVFDNSNSQQLQV